MAIGSQDRLYQFLAMSDEDSQRIMWQTVRTMGDDENPVVMDESYGQGGNKRYEESLHQGSVK